MQESIAFLLRVHCRRKESSRSLSHLLMSFLSSAVILLRPLIQSFISAEHWSLLIINDLQAQTQLPPSPATTQQRDLIAELYKSFITYLLEICVDRPTHKSIVQYVYQTLLSAYVNSTLLKNYYQPDVVLCVMDNNNMFLYKLYQPIIMQFKSSYSHSFHMQDIRILTAN